MKTVKRALALVLALTLLLAMSATVFAADDTYTITISGDNVVAGHTYEAYQIFKGDLAEKDGKTILSNIEWGSGVNGDALLTALKADATFDNGFKMVFFYKNFITPLAQKQLISKASCYIRAS